MLQMMMMTMFKCVLCQRGGSQPTAQHGIVPLQFVVESCIRRRRRSMATALQVINVMDWSEINWPVNLSHLAAYLQAL